MSLTYLDLDFCFFSFLTVLSSIMISRSIDCGELCCAIQWLAGPILNAIRERVAAVAMDVKALLTGALVFEGGIGHLVSVNKHEVQIGHVVAACHIQES